MFPSRRTVAYRFAAVCFALAIASTPFVSARADDLDLGKYRGKVVYLDFWASWCGPCKQSFPWMDRMQAALGNRGFVVLAVNLDKERRLADKFLESHPAALRVVFDPSGDLAKRYQVKTMPTSLVIGRDGKVRAVHAGFREQDEGEYETNISTALSDPGPQLSEQN